MNIWAVSLENADWDNPYQSIMVATQLMDMEEAIAVTRGNFSGLIVEVKHVGFAHLTKAPDPTEST